MTDWRHEAACLEEDPELFFPVGSSGSAVLQIAEAKEVCGRCDVVETCLRWALDTGQDAGIWGAMTEDERRAYSRRQRRAERDSAPPTRRYIDAEATRTLIAGAVSTSGWSLVHLAEVAGIAESTVKAIVGGRQEKLTERTATRIRSALVIGPAAAGVPAGGAR